MGSDPTAPPPSIMGATGGSGTRVVARVARRAGLFIGTNLNPAEDALEIAAYYDRWINPYIQQTHGWGADVEAEMRAELGPLLERHREGADGRAWGWKEPRSIFLVPFLATRAARPAAAAPGPGRSRPRLLEEPEPASKARRHVSRVRVGEA